MSAGAASAQRISVQSREGVIFGGFFARICHVVWGYQRTRARPVRVLERVAVLSCCCHIGQKRSTECIHEPFPSAASVNGRPAGICRVGPAGAQPRRSRQGHLRHQLGRRGRAWRLLPGGCRRHLQKIRPRRQHRSGRAEREQPHVADRRQDRFLHGREHADVVRCSRQQCSGRDRRGGVPERSAGDADASRCQGHQDPGPQAADAVRLEGRHDQLLPVAEVRIWFQREERPPVQFQPAALHRQPQERDAGLRNLRALRSREGRRLQAQRASCSPMPASTPIRR